MDEQCSSAGSASVPSTESSSSSRVVDVPIIVPAFVFSLGYGEGALMDPSKQRSAFDDSPCSDEQAVSTFSAGLGGEAIERGRQGTVEESQNQQQAVSSSSRGFGGESVISHLGRQDAPSSMLSSVRHSPASSSLRFSDKDFMNHKEQRASLSSFGHSDGDIMNQLVPQRMFEKPLELCHQQHSVPNLGSGDHEFAKHLEPQDAFGETLDRDQQPAFLYNLGLRDKSIADRKDSLHAPLRPDETYESTLNQLRCHDELKNQTNGEAQPSADQSSAADTFQQSTQQSIVECHPPDTNQKASHAFEDAEPLVIDLTPVSPSSPPSWQINGEGQLKEQDALEELLKSQQPEELVTDSTSAVSQQPPEHKTEFDDSPIEQEKMESDLAAVLFGTDEPTMSLEASLHTPSSDDSAMKYPGSEMRGGQACHQQCVREGCPNPAVASGEWDGEYCSTECVVSHCNKAFSSWVACRLDNEGAVPRTSLSAEWPYLQH